MRLHTFCMQPYLTHSHYGHSLLGCRYLASGSFDKTVDVWDVQEGAVLRTFLGESGIFEVLLSRNFASCDLIDALAGPAALLRDTYTMVARK